MELLLLLFEIVAWIVAYAIAIFGAFMVAAAVWYVYVSMKEAEDDE